ncbi:uncharacterized protein [Drosophila takahashii]|uniref:uncharacterized protein n=1 Tax=Drosophila takahashii TaxID=29030 RepID=UPI001CF8FAC7|nr:uncharacterized protein At4g17910-like [Drosophila takahashii]
MEPIPNPSSAHPITEERPGEAPIFDWDWTETLAQSWETLLLILSTFWCILLARVVTQKLQLHDSPNLCYAVEFGLVILPCILLITVAVDYSNYIGFVMFSGTLWFLRKNRVLERARTRGQFDLGGNRHMALSVLRALTHLITAINILAIDFGSYYRPYRKSLQFGAKLMDTGIGLFVFTMAMVSRRTHNWSDLRRIAVYSVLPLILLGLARSATVLVLGYGQDIHEYGQHLNAFFTLVFTKFFGALLNILARKDLHLLPLGFGILLIHQFGLSFLGVSDYVMNDDVDRTNFFNANREGLVSLPGFVGLYGLSIYVNRWMVASSLLSYSELVRKLRRLLLVVLLLWSLFVISAYGIGISRMTCNLGYVIWMLAIGSTSLWASFGAIDFVINSVMPWESSPSDEQEKGLVTRGTVAKGGDKSIVSFTISQALNQNGLTFFVVANVLNGAVNKFLRPEDRSNCESVIILLVYMFLGTRMAYELLKRGIRLA